MTQVKSTKFDSIGFISYISIYALQLLNEALGIRDKLVADPRVARDKFVFDSVIILYY